MQTANMAEYFRTESEMGHVNYLSDQLEEAMESRFSDLRLLDELADPELDTELLVQCSHDNDVVIGMIYSAQAAIAEATEMIRRRPVFAVQKTQHN